MLGIPTVLDRLIQQALHQVMSPVWEPDFSDHSYGFRPGRGGRPADAKQSMREAIEHFGPNSTFAFHMACLAALAGQLSLTGGAIAAYDVASQKLLEMMPSAIC